MNFFTTYFDHHYLAKGLTLYHSLTRHCSPFTLFILCMDEITFQILTKMNLPFIHCILLSDFERYFPDLLVVKPNRSLIEYYFTCTPALPLYVLKNFPDVAQITYIDSDFYFFSSVDPIFQEMSNESILIIGHRLPPGVNVKATTGIYNVGFLSFKKDKNGIECLEWWFERCLEWCYDRVEDGKYADQKYLDDWPQRFPGVVILQHLGAGLAPWNIMNYDYSFNGDTFLVNDQPLIMFHFSNLEEISRHLYNTNVSCFHSKMSTILIEGIYIPYILNLKKSKKELERVNFLQHNYQSSIRRTKNNPSIKSQINNVIAIIHKILNKEIIWC